MSTLAAEDRDQAEWHSLVGKAIVLFGEIELISIRCLTHLPSDHVVDTAARLEFGRRVDLLLEILTPLADPGGHIGGLINDFDKAKNLAKTRNLIAHNPVMLDLYVNEARDDHRVERTIRSARGDADPFTLEDLKKFAADVESLASQLWLHYLSAVKYRDVPFREYKDNA